MKFIKNNLINQLVSIGIFVFVIMFLTLGIFLPKSMVPIYEGHIYNYLKQPLSLISSNIDNENIIDNVAYLCIHSHEDIFVSDNLNNIIPVEPKQIINNIKSEYGKFVYLGKKYYYYTSDSNGITKIALTDSTYITQMKKDVVNTIFPILFITFLVIISSMTLWASNLVLKIKHLKNKVDNLDNDEYTESYQFKENDELSVLSRAIDDMHQTLCKQEEYKSQMYQSISHDLKTPLTVIKSYIEAIEDGVEDKNKGKFIIKEQLQKLENKVESLLYLNKLNYMKEIKKFENKQVDLSKIVKNSIEKFKFERSDIKWKVIINDKKTKYKGTEDIWEAIIDNMLQNFIRYADEKVEITFKNNKIIFYNDGPNIDENILNTLFTPYEKGIKGQFGLGLSIIKKSLHLIGYQIVVCNEKKGVTFTIY